MSMPAQRKTLLAQAKEQASSPGVYCMKDEADLILYVGKAKNLKNRLLSYFQANEHEIPKVEFMLKKVSQVSVILTETESEALILEQTLIKKHKPRYNVRLKDDKSYPYLSLDLKQETPRLELVRRVSSSSSSRRYFGPFPSTRAARQVQRLLNTLFQLRDCSDNAFRHRSRPCILYQMQRCGAPCVDYISTTAYHEQIKNVIEVLEGKSDQLHQSLRQAMELAASREDYERASLYRDQIAQLELITQMQGVLDPASKSMRDVLGLALSAGRAHACLLNVRHGKLTAVQHFEVQNTDATDSASDLLESVLAQYYFRLRDLPANLPNEVLIPQSDLDFSFLERALALKVVCVDQKLLDTTSTSLEQQLLNLAFVNAQNALDQAKKREVHHGLQALEEVQKVLQLSQLPQRIECYDISNLQGGDAVASRVVFLDATPEKSAYRRYKIRSVKGANDFAMLYEVLERRFRRKEEALPDLIVVDGGKGQLAQAVLVLKELDIVSVDVVGLAKARTEQAYQKRELNSSFERIFIPNRKNPIPLLAHTAAYRLLTHLRDEAHRFAIGYHRKLRHKRTFSPS